MERLWACCWSNTGGAQLVEINFKYFWSTTSATGSITNTSMYVCIYVYLNNMYYIYIYIHTFTSKYNLIHTCICIYNIYIIYYYYIYIIYIYISWFKATPECDGKNK